MVVRGDVKAIQRLLTILDLNQIDPGKAALKMASLRGDSEVVKLLLDAGADMNHVDSNGVTALELASFKGHIEIVQLLYKKGALRNLSHEDLMQLGEALGYPSVRGLCNGIAHKGIEAFLTVGMNVFENRLKKINLALQKLEEDGLFLKNLSKNRSDENLICLRKAIEATSPDLFVDLLAFFDGVYLYQAPKKCLEFFEDSKRPVLNQSHLDFVTEISSLTSSVGLEFKGGLKEISKFTGIYNESELVDYFDSLQRVLEAGSLQDLIAIKVSSVSHATSIGYDPLEKIWVFIDVNKGIPRKILTSNSLAKEVLLAFTSGKETVLSSIVYCAKSSEPRSKEKEKTWEQTVEFKRIHEVTIKKARTLSTNFKMKDISWFHVAVKEGDLERVKLLIDIGVDPNSIFSNEKTALMQAASNGHVEIVKLLLDAKADVNFPVKGITTLMTAAFEGHAEIVKLLLDAKVNVNFESGGFAAIRYAVVNNFPKIVKLLLDAGADPNAVDLEGRTALDAAILRGHTEIIELLMALKK